MPDFDPCGMIVDLIRSCYYVDMSMFSNRPDLITRVRWFFADDNALPLPFPTCFGSGNWASQDRLWEGPGEALPRHRRYNRGSNVPFYGGQHACGTADQFSQGTLYPPGAFPRNPEGVPDCCLASPPPPPPPPLTCAQVWGFMPGNPPNVTLNITGLTTDPVDPSYCDLTALDGIHVLGQVFMSPCFYQVPIAGFNLAMVFGADGSVVLEYYDPISGMSLIFYVGTPVSPVLPFTLTMVLQAGVCGNQAPTISVVVS
jgi:hypothetical protein